MKNCKYCGLVFPEDVAAITKMDDWKGPYKFSILSGVTFCNSKCEDKSQHEFFLAFLRLPTCISTSEMDGKFPEGYTEGYHFKYEELHGEGAYVYNQSLEESTMSYEFYSFSKEFMKKSTFSRNFIPVDNLPEHLIRMA